MPGVIADYELVGLVGCVIFMFNLKSDVSFYEMQLSLSFVVYSNLRSVASSCDIPPT